METNRPAFGAPHQRRWRIDSGGGGGDFTQRKRATLERQRQDLTEMTDSVKIVPVDANHSTGKTSKSAYEAAVTGYGPDQHFDRKASGSRILGLKQ